MVAIPAQWGGFYHDDDNDDDSDVGSEYVFSGATSGAWAFKSQEVRTRPAVEDSISQVKTALRYEGVVEGDAQVEVGDTVLSFALESPRLGTPTLSPSPKQDTPSFRHFLRDRAASNVSSCSAMDAALDTDGWRGDFGLRFDEMSLESTLRSPSDDSLSHTSRYEDMGLELRAQAFLDRSLPWSEGNDDTFRFTHLKCDESEPGDDESIEYEETLLGDFGDTADFRAALSQVAPPVMDLPLELLKLQREYSLAIQRTLIHSNSRSGDVSYTDFNPPQRTLEDRRSTILANQDLRGPSKRNKSDRSVPNTLATGRRAGTGNGSLAAREGPVLGRRAVAIKTAFKELTARNASESSHIPGVRLRRFDEFRFKRGGQLRSDLDRRGEIEKADETFRPKITELAKSIARSFASGPPESIGKEKFRERMERHKEEIESREMSECTFQPFITEMAKQSPSLASGQKLSMPIKARRAVETKAEMLAKRVQECTFQPKTNKRPSGWSSAAHPFTNSDEKKWHLRLHKTSDHKLFDETTTVESKRSPRKKDKARSSISVAFGATMQSPIGVTIAQGAPQRKDAPTVVDKKPSIDGGCGRERFHAQALVDRNSLHTEELCTSSLVSVSPTAMVEKAAAAAAAASALSARSLQRLQGPRALAAAPPKTRLPEVSAENSEELDEKETGIMEDHEEIADDETMYRMMCEAIEEQQEDAESETTEQMPADQVEWMNLQRAVAQFGLRVVDSGESDDDDAKDDEEYDDGDDDVDNADA